MRVIYFTYVQSQEYLRFYYKPAVQVDGVIAIYKGHSFVYFKTPQNNVQNTLRVIDKDIELEDCRFSYRLEDLLYYIANPDITRVCKHTTMLLSNLLLKFPTDTISDNNSEQQSPVSDYAYPNLKNSNVFKRPLSFLN